MKSNFYLILIAILLFASCSTLQQGAVNDDLYYSPKDEPARTKVVAVNEPSENKDALADRNLDKEITAILEDDSKEGIDTTIYQSEDEYENPYESIVVDSYAEALERRRAAIFDPYYGVSNSYFLRFSDDYWYAQAYMGDPYYNVVFMGNSVWVEPYWMGGYYNNSLRYFNPYGYYSYYNPYYYGYSSSYWGYPYYSYNNWYSANNSIYNQFHSGTSQRQRSLGRTVAGSSRISSRSAREEYMGRDISTSSTVKSATDTRSVRTESSARISGTNRVSDNKIAGETIRLKETRTATGTSSNSIRSTDRRSSTGATSGSSRNYTRPNQSSRSTYSSPSSSNSRYNRPTSTNVRSGKSSTGITRSSSSGSSRSGSTYSPSRTSTTRSSGTSTRSSGTSTRSSGSSVRSSGSSSRSSGSSSGSSRSSGSSSSSSSSSSRGGRR